MPYVQRFADGSVQGLNNMPQPGRAEEFLPDDAPEVVSFRSGSGLNAQPSATVEEIGDDEPKS